MDFSLDNLREWSNQKLRQQVELFNRLKRKYIYFFLILDM